MRQYALRRLLFFVPVLLATSALTFFAVNMVPGDPALIVFGQDATQEQIDNFHAVNGLDQPLLERYKDWLWGLLRGDPGRSFAGGMSIQSELKARFPVTLSVLVFSFAFTMFFGVTFGIVAAVFQDRSPDYAVRVFSIFGQSVPEFFTLTLLMLVPATLWRYSPPFGWVPWWEDPLRVARQVIPPTLILSIGSAAFLMRIMRSSLLEVLRQDYVRTARAKGLTERVVLLRHALKNALIPVLTIAGFLLSGLLGGSIILESITSLPGLGQYALNAIFQRDFNVIMTMVMYAAMLVMTMNLIVDLLYAYVDPRIRYE